MIPVHFEISRFDYLLGDSILKCVISLKNDKEKQNEAIYLINERRCFFSRQFL